MSRVVLVLWNEGEARERAERLRALGHDVVVHWRRESEGLRKHRERPPQALVIDLDRLPSHGRAVAAWFRGHRGSRGVPIVFAGGAPDKVARARELLPDATYTTWRAIGGALRRAIAHPPGAPVVPGAMDEYRGRPLAGKLGLRDGVTLLLVNAPAGFESALAPLPEGARVVRRSARAVASVMLFVRTRSELVRRFPGAARALAQGGGLWIAWPKHPVGTERRAGAAGDLTQQAVREFGLAAGFVDHKICAVDETWSGLRFVRRRA
ncbi:MAG: hypothetical protein KBD01_07740 [Acidobacteria bacterium]|nr:hypothetical protein [Acidobacteriota bacterium]